MSETRLRHDGRTLVVTLASDGGATVDDREHRLGTVVPAWSAAVGPATVEELVIEVDGRTVRAVVARTRERVLVAADGRAWTFEVGDDARGTGGAAGSGSVVAPMPGKIVKVLVAPGDRAEPGQPLVVIEAMKMETTLAAEIAGTVTTVNASAGTMADAGALLVEITPDPP